MLSLLNPVAGTLAAPLDLAITDAELRGLRGFDADHVAVVQAVGAFGDVESLFRRHVFTGVGFGQIEEFQPSVGPVADTNPYSQVVGFARSTHLTLNQYSPRKAHTIPYGGTSA